MGNSVIVKKIKSKYKIAGATIVGRGHITKNIPCQDKIFSAKDSSFNFIGLADGAGSCSHSDIGAAFVLKETLKLIKKKFDRYYRGEYSIVNSDILSYLKLRLEILAKNKRIAFKELSSTLLFVAVKENKFIAGHLGDGVIGYLKCGELKVLSDPVNGEFANATYFVTSSDAKQYFKLFKGELNEINGFVLMSDGSEESLYDKRNKSLAPAVGQMFEWLGKFKENEVSKALENNLRDVIRLKTIDDCSVILLKL